MKKVVLVMLLTVMASVAMANPSTTDLKYSVGKADAQGNHLYNFDLKYLGTGGDQVGWFIFGSAYMYPFDPNNPINEVGQWGWYQGSLDFEMTSPIPLPWTWLSMTSGSWNGATFGEPFTFWAPNPGDSLTWSGTSHADLSGVLMFTYLDEGFNWNNQLGTYVPTTPEPSSLILLGTGILAAFGGLNRRFL